MEGQMRKEEAMATRTTVDSPQLKRSNQCWECVAGVGEPQGFLHVTNEDIILSKWHLAGQSIETRPKELGYR